MKRRRTSKPKARTTLRPGVFIQQLSLSKNVILPAPTAITAFIGRAAGGPVNSPVPISNFGEYEKRYGQLRGDDQLRLALRDFFSNGGVHALVVRIKQERPDLEEALLAAIKALAGADLFNLLCIPPVNDEDIPASVWQAAAAYCRERRAFLIIDPSRHWKDAGTAKAGVGSMFKDPNAAVYFPRLRQQGEPDRVPCGAVAGIYARTDAQRGVWKAPAGTEAVLQGVESFNITLSDVDLQDLNALNINCLRMIPSLGPAIWGARTLAGDNGEGTLWKYVPVRRLFLFIEESVERGTSWTVFEPNDEPLWAMLRSSISAFMQDLFVKGAFQGATPDEAYFVRCDSSTTRESDKEQGVVNILLGFAPLKPAEFVILRIQLTAEG